MTFDPFTPSWNDPPVESKLTVPELPQDFVRRPRPQQRLDTGIESPLTCVLAPAGWGKTCLAAGWVASAGKVGWVTLEAGDDETDIFWRYLCCALSAVGVYTDQLAAHAGTRQFIDELANRIVQFRAPVIVVLDNFHALTSGWVITGLALLLRHASPHLRLVLLSRRDPQLPIARYRISGRYHEIRGPELAFTFDEACALVAQRPGTVSPSAMKALLARTEGWPAGLRLFLQSAPDDDPIDDWVGAFAGRDRLIADYLQREVLDDLPRDVREILESTSIARRLPVDLAVELSGRTDAGSVLERLHSQHAFVDSTEAGTYRYHPLFAGVLQSRLRHAQSGKAATLHRKAGHWLAHEGLSLDALWHARQAKDWHFVARLIVDQQLFLPLLLGDAGPALMESARAIPEYVMQRDPAAAVVGAILAVEANDDLRAQSLLDRLDRLERMDSCTVPLAVTIARLRLANRRPDGTGDAAKYAESARATLADTPTSLASVRTQAQGLISAERALALISDDRLDEADTVLAEAREKIPNNNEARHLIVGVQAFLCALRGKLSRAGELARAELEKDERPTVPSRGTGYCHLALAWVGAERCERPRARDELILAGAAWTRQDALFWGARDVIERRIGRLVGPLKRVGGRQERINASSGPRLTAMRAYQLIAQGDARTAEALLAAIHAASTEERIQLARARLALGDPWGALEGARAIAESTEELPLGVDANLVVARAAAETGRPNLAARTLIRAVHMSERERIRRPFLDAGPWLRRAMPQLIDNPRHYAWLGTTVLGRPASDRGSTAPAPRAQPLTGREQDILRKLFEARSTKDIATEMFLSINTVKTHLGSIYRKLTVSGRWEAIRRARDLGLL
jgi:LuxR family transcriptional regulator, maltose regulon positive regulatory protein